MISGLFRNQKEETVLLYARAVEKVMFEEAQNGVRVRVYVCICIFV